MTGDQLTPEQIAAWGAKSRAAAGVPERIEDPAVLARLVTLALGGADERDGGGPPSTRRRSSRKQPAATRRAAEHRTGADGS